MSPEYTVSTFIHALTTHGSGPKTDKRTIAAAELSLRDIFLRVRAFDTKQFISEPNMDEFTLILDIFQELYSL